MKRTLALALMILAACGGKKNDSVYQLSRSPVSVRGWVLDVKDAKRGATIEMEIARRGELFAASSVWVENSQYASGGIAENGAFIVLDVPPLNATLGFNAPGAENARVTMKNVPGNADVFLPDLILEKGGAKFLDPSTPVVRMPSSEVSKPTPTGKFAIIAGIKVPIVDTPLAQMNDRRDYPSPPGFRPVATVK